MTTSTKPSIETVCEWKAGRSLTHYEASNTMEAATILRETLESRFSHYITRAGGRPLLAQYSGDARCFKTRSFRVGQPTPYHRVRREGECSHEVYSMACFLIGDDMEEPEATCVLRPIILASKTQWHTFAAAKEFCKPIRSFGHNGYVIQACAWDRGELSQNRRLFMQYWDWCLWEGILIRESNGNDYRA